MRKLFMKGMRTASRLASWVAKRRRALSRRTGLWTALSLVQGAGLGIGAMYLLDPNRGRARRALLRDKVMSTAHTVQDSAAVGVRDLAHRAQGLVAEARSSLDKAPMTDEALVQHIRAELGHHVTFPRAIEVEVRSGDVILRGPILRGEHRALVRTLRKLRGVRKIEDRLELHKGAEDLPGAQGGAPRAGRQPELLQESWAPGPRLLAGLAGGALGLACALRRRRDGAMAGLLGGALLVRALTNRPLVRLLGVGGRRRAVDLQKTIEVDAPLEEVFQLWSHFENFPRFMDRVREVKVSNGQSHWRVAGPAGVTVEWDAEVSARIPNELVAWRTLPGQLIEHSGVIRFEKTPEDTTRLSIRMSYTPPAGALGHAVATLLGADPKRAMDEDLVRFKSLLETGRTRAHHRQTQLDEVRPEQPEQPSPPDQPRHP